MLKYIFTFLLIAPLFLFGQINQKDSQGRKQGVWKKPYPQNTVFQYVGQFKDDKPVGEWSYYYPSGNLKVLLKYTDKGVTSYAQMFHESGFLMAKGKYVNQQKDSTWITFDDRGYVSAQETYKLGVLHGERIIYFQPEGNTYPVAEYANYKNGILHGEYKKFHPNKKLALEGTYVDGNKNGVFKHYHYNGKIALIERYKYTVKHGYQIAFTEDGVQEGYKLYWEGVELKGEALKKKEAELKAEKDL
jgi:antitoxin component YwqK of YwqJK toxin-antitoxin module